MSILFSKRGKTIIKWMWIFVATLLILSMIFAYSGSVEMFSPSATTHSSPSS